MNARENLLRAVQFERPERIPTVFGVSAACWHHYPPEAIRELMVDHASLFPYFDPAEDPAPKSYRPGTRAGEPYTDPWGCVWETADDGIAGTVTGHPLADWDAFDGYVPPDPAETNGMLPTDWDQIARQMTEAREKGELLRGGLTHGHTFLRLCDIRGYTNLIYDMTDQEPRLPQLIEMVEQFNMDHVRRYLDLGVEYMSYPEDLGMQVGPMLSPEHMRQYIKPSYQRLMAPAREAGCIVHMHSDGDIRALVDDLIDGGVEVVNLQDLVNGIDWIKDTLAGKVCIDLDIDRQEIIPYGTPTEIDAHVRRCVETLGSKQGGLMLLHGWYPGVPLENAKAVMDAMEKYSTHFA